MGIYLSSCLLYTSYYETDPQFSTSHDFKVAKILANELLEIYLTNRLHELERREQRKRMKKDVYKRQPLTSIPLISLRTKIYLVTLLIAFVTIFLSLIHI